MWLFRARRARSENCQGSDYRQRKRPWIDNFLVAVFLVDFADFSSRSSDASAMNYSSSACGCESPGRVRRRRGPRSVPSKKNHFCLSRVIIERTEAGVYDVTHVRGPSSLWSCVCRVCVHVHLGGWVNTYALLSSWFHRGSIAGAKGVDRGSRMPWLVPR